MRLDDYMQLAGLTDSDLQARMIYAAKFVLPKGEHFMPAQQTINEARRHARVPRPEFMRVLYAVTGGDVGPADYYQLPEGIANRMSAPGYWDQKEVQAGLETARIFHEQWRRP